MRISPQSLGLVHFIGIGGIGMSGIAEILHHLGYQVQGSDINENYNVARLRQCGIPCFIGHDPAYVANASVVVISSDIRMTNSEVQAARRLRIPIVRRAEMLAEIMRLRPCIAVAGTHGKTTTTSIGATVLDTAGLDPTVISGGIINSYGTNARLGKGEWTIVEADESDGTFIKLPATHAIITNIDPEHMNFYGSFENLYQAFKTYIENIPFYGLGIICFDHPTTRKLAQEITDRRIVTYGLEEGADVQATDIELKEDGMHFNLVFSDHFYQIVHAQEQVAKVAHYHLSMPGIHNVQNALAIIISGLELGLTHGQIQAGLAQFKGVKRRFTSIGEWQGCQFIDDYAHHPAEVTAVINTACQLSTCQLSKGKVIAVLQPHRYSRLKNLIQEFADALTPSDIVFITPLYSAGEDYEGIDHRDLIQALINRNHPHVYEVENIETLAHYLKGIAMEGDQVVFMGAGDITYWGPKVLALLSRPSVEWVAEKVVRIA